MTRRASAAGTTARAAAVVAAMWSALVLLALAAGAAARNFSAQEVHQLPQLYELDDYDRCLARPGALYCVGTFLSAPRQASAPHYRLMEEYSADPLHFNRTLLHRGYCVSARCPGAGGAGGGPDASARFLACVQDSEQQLGMRLSLGPHRCDPGPPGAPDPPGVPAADAAADLLLWVVRVFLLLNCIGTAYDSFVISKKKNKFLLAWSVPYNWQRLTSTREEADGSSSLALIQGTRILMMVIVVSSHVLTVSHQLYLSNPHSLEKVYRLPAMMILRNGSNFVQMFVIISNMLFTYSLIQIAKRRKIGFLQFPIFLVHRIIRLTPVHLLVVGFAATWWRHTGDGPQWADLVVAESDVCRRKFLLHALFLHNLVDNDEHCLIQTWFLAVDMQMFIVASLVLITLMKTQWRPLPILSGLIVVSVVMNGLLSYFNGWKPPIHVVNPENMRQLFRGSSTVRDYYISPWGSLPACFLGILTGYAYEEIRERGRNFNDNKLFALLAHAALPLAFSWVLAGAWVFERRSPLAAALYLALERPVLCVLICVLFVGMATSPDHPLRRALSWRGWHAPGRLSLSVLMVHWCVIKVFMASRRTLTDYSLMNTSIESCAACFFSYCLALPLTLLVEMPLMKTFSSALVG